MEVFAVECVEEIVVRELRNVSPLFRSAPDDLSSEHLTGLSFSQLISQLSSPDGCPILWRILGKLDQSTMQVRRNRMKVPSLIQLMQVSMALYSRNRNFCCIHKALALYLKVSGLSA